MLFPTHRIVFGVSASFAEFGLMYFGNDKATAKTVLDSCIDKISDGAKSCGLDDIETDKNCWLQRPQNAPNFYLNQIFFRFDEDKHDEFTKAIKKAKDILKQEGFKRTMRNYD